MGILKKKITLWEVLTPGEIDQCSKRGLPPRTKQEWLLNIYQLTIAGAGFQEQKHIGSLCSAKCQRHSERWDAGGAVFAGPLIYNAGAGA